MLFAQLSALIARLAESSPVALVLDNLQWADASSIELLHAVQHALAPNPAALLAELARLRHEAPLGEDALLRLESDAQRVAVVTVHRSKGLEYPIVYHPFAHEGRRASAPSGWSLSWRDAEDRQVLDYAAEQLDDARQSARELEEAAEELRLHYVALTRAMLRCVLSVGPYSVGRSSKPSRRAALHALVVAEQALAAPSVSAQQIQLGASAAMTATSFARQPGRRLPACGVGAGAAARARQLAGGHRARALGTSPRARRRCRAPGAVAHAAAAGPGPCRAHAAARSARPLLPGRSARRPAAP